MDNAKGESLKVGLDGSIKLEFHGAKVTSDGGLLVYRDLDDALGLFDSVATIFSDRRTGRNVQHELINIGAKVVKHSRYVTFQMAEVTISKKIFTEIIIQIKK